MIQLLHKSRLRLLVILAAGIAVAGIFYQGTRPGKESNTASHEVTRWLEGGLNTLGVSVDDYHFHKRVRKTAHCIEYGLAGLLIAWCMIIFLPGRPLIQLWGSILCICFLAFLDEYIQGWLERTRKIEDAELDIFAASLSIILLVTLHLFRALRTAKTIEEKAAEENQPSEK